MGDYRRSPVFNAANAKFPNVIYRTFKVAANNYAVIIYTRTTTLLVSMTQYDYVFTNIVSGMTKGEWILQFRQYFEPVRT